MVQDPKITIFLPTTPFAVRNDYSVGNWKVGDDDFRGNTIEISIIKVSQYFGSLGKTKDAQWLQVFFEIRSAKSDQLEQHKQLAAADSK